MQLPNEVSLLLPPDPRGRLGSPAPRPLLPMTPPQAASPPRPAPLSALYSSAFALDCEAIALQLQAAREDSRWPEPPPGLRRASTIDAETLTPLGPSCSFLSEAGRTPAPDAWTPPSRRSQPPCNRTYEYQDEASAGPFSSRLSPWASSGATYLCEERSRLSTASLAAVAGARFPSSLAAEDDDDCAARRRTFEWELPAAAAGGDDSAPLVTSTPLVVVAAAADQGPELAAKRSASLLADAQRLAQPARGTTLHSAPGEPAGRPKLGSGGKTPRGSLQGASALRKKLVSTAAAAKRSALPTRTKGLAPEASPGAGPAKTSLRGPAGAAAALPALRGAGAELPGACLQRSGVPGASAGCAGQSQALAKKQLPVEMKKTQTKLPCSKRLPFSIQPPSKLNRGAVAGAAGNNRIAKARAQKRPQEKPSDTVSTQKHPFLKQAYQGKGQTEKPTSGVLPAAGQICRTTSGTGSAAFCLECPRLLQENQRLLKENQQLKIMLDKYCHKQNMNDSLSL